MATPSTEADFAAKEAARIKKEEEDFAKAHAESMAERRRILESNNMPLDDQVESSVATTGKLQKKDAVVKEA